MMKIDLEKLLPLLKRGETVVLLAPGLEPLVLMSVVDYDSLVSKANAKSGKIPPSSAPLASSGIETIDPPAGILTDDDQYFPEPLD